MAARRIPIYQVLLNDDDNTGVNLISFVDNPAIQSNFVALSKQFEHVKLALEAAKQILTGPVLIPDQKIVRLDDQQQPYYITFSAPTIEAIRNKFFKQKLTHNTNSEHEIALDGNYVVESWIITDSDRDKSVALGLEPLPVGTWMVSYKVEDSKYWQEEISTGKRKGFSLEGFFDYRAVEMAAAERSKDAPMVYQQYMGANLGYTRDKMPQISQETMDVFRSYFVAKYGSESITEGKAKASDLKPSQSEMNEEKVRGKVEDGGFKTRQYIISSDNYLLDGHHDWAAALETDPSTELSTLQIALPAQELIAESNQLKITSQEALSAIINTMPTTKEEKLEDIQINGGGVVRYNPITRKLYTADGNLLPSGTYSMPDGTTFKVETNQYIYEVSEPVGTKMSAVALAKQSLSVMPETKTAGNAPKASANQMAAGVKLKKAYAVLAAHTLFMGLTKLSPELKQALNDVQTAAQLATTSLQDGTAIEIDEATGQVFTLDTEGKRGPALADGDYTLADGSSLSVKEGKKAEAMSQQPADNAAAVQELADAKAAATAAEAKAATLSTEVETLKAQIAKLSAAPATTPIERENPGSVKLSAGGKRVETLRRQQSVTE